MVNSDDLIGDSHIFFRGAVRNHGAIRDHCQGGESWVCGRMFSHPWQQNGMHIIPSKAWDPAYIKLYVAPPLNPTQDLYSYSCMPARPRSPADTTADNAT